MLVALALPAAEWQAGAAEPGKASAPATPKPTTKPKPKPKSPDHYTPTTGVTLNNPLGSRTSRLVSWRKLYRTINSVPTGGKIRIASWNVRSGGLVNALIAAHKRGISVRVTMDRSNIPPNTSNRDYRRLRRALSTRNVKRPTGMRSWLRVCGGSCRGPSGISHSKFYLFSQAGKAKNIVMYGSNNMTDNAANIQWNDLYTLANADKFYADFMEIFTQMATHKSVKNPFRSFTVGPRTINFYPNTGPGTTKNPVLTVLNQVKCTGAGAAGINGRTKIRVGQTATYGNLGMALAKKVVQLKRQGCNIRIAYAMFGGNVLQVLRAGHVPLVHVAIDTNEDGIYDKYIHLKVMTIQGNFAGKSNQQISWNGSSNWTSVSLASDDVQGMVDQVGITKRYANWIDRMYNHPPFGLATRSARMAAGISPLFQPQVPVDTTFRSQTIVRRAGVNPYAHMQLN